MYKNLNPAALGVSGRQSELIELALTYGFKGLDFEAAELLKRATVQGVDEAAKYIRSGKLEIGGWLLPAKLAANDQAFQADLEGLASLAPIAQKMGFRACTVNIDPGSDDMPFHENFERHRERLAKIADILERLGIRLGLRLQSTAAQREGRKFPFIHQAEELLTLIRTTNHKGVGLALDTWSWKVGGGANDQLSELQGHQIVTVSLADVPEDADLATVKITDRLLLTVDTVDENAKLLAILVACGYEGPVTIMPHASKMAKLTRDASVERCSTLLSKLWSAAGVPKEVAPTEAATEPKAAS